MQEWCRNTAALSTSASSFRMVCERDGRDHALEERRQEISPARNSPINGHTPITIVLVATPNILQTSLDASIILEH